MLSLEDALRTGEAHGVEFKKSLGELREGAQTVVAFANTHGGDLFFGVAPDGRVVGISVGANTLERLAADLERYVYPYAPVAIDPIPAPDGKTVVRVSVVADAPPVVGVYLYSSQPIDPEAPMGTSQLHAYRRVGRTNRRVPDFSWLRPRLPTDPVMMIERGSTGRGNDIPRSLGGTVWLVAGSAQAYELRFRLDPDLAPPRDGASFLPTPDGKRTASFNFDPLRSGTGSDPPDGVWAIVEYRDDGGCVWESAQWVKFAGGEAESTTIRRRRLVALPPKTRTA